MTSHSSGDYLVGIEYEAIDDQHGHFTIRRKILLAELIDELKGFVLNGHYYPQFPREANPSIMYAYNLSQSEDADIYGEVVNALNKSLKRSNNGQNMDNYQTDNR